MGATTHWLYCTVWRSMKSISSAVTLSSTFSLPSCAHSDGLCTCVTKVRCWKAGWPCCAAVYV